uniref:Uncharacterized protein n=1 Tax=Mycena chlorophos TaxID=658473 RepID=A0ABQ0LG59_MYCCL|nr:predicted protein [Mycena chlorophos]
MRDRHATGKSDSLTLDEKATFKAKIRGALVYHNIRLCPSTRTKMTRTRRIRPSTRLSAKKSPSPSSARRPT